MSQERFCSHSYIIPPGRECDCEGGACKASHLGPTWPPFQVASWEKYSADRPRGDVNRQAAFNAGFAAAIELAAKIADDWSHGGDPGEAMYASSRIRDRIKRAAQR